MIALLLIVLSFAILSLNIAVMGWLLTWLNKHLTKSIIYVFLSPLLFAAGVVLQEWVYTLHPLSLAWSFQGYSQWTLFEDWYPLIGVFGVSFITASISAYGAQLLQLTGKSRLIMGGIVGGCNYCCCGGWYGCS